MTNTRKANLLGGILDLLAFAFAPKPAPAAAAAPATPRPSAPAKPMRAKVKLITDMLRRPSGATIAEMQEKTGWKPHTVSARFAEIRRAGFAIERADEPRGRVFHAKRVTQ